MWKRLTYPMLFIVALVLLAGSPALAQIRVNTDPSLIAWYKLDEMSGTTAADSSPSGNDGTLNGGAQWVAGWLGGALQFNGANAYVDCGAAAGNGITDSITLAAWINCDTFADWRGIISKGINNAPYAMQIWGSGSLRFAANWGTVPGEVGGGEWNSANPLPAQEWVHAAVTAVPGSLTFYINGVPQQVSINLQQFGTLNESLILGCDFPGGDEFFDGMIDDARIYSTALSQTDIQAVMLGLPSEIASAPNPQDGQTDVPQNAVLSWMPGEFAASHDVYFGTSLDDVTAASRSNPRDVLVNQGQTDAMYDPDGLLEFGQTYYWRIDEVNAPPSNAIHPGEVWSFTAEPFSYAIDDVNATASTTSAAGEGPNRAVDGSGLDANGQHSTNQGEMWLGAAQAGEPVWIQFDFDKVYRLDQMRLWNYNVPFELYLGFSLKNVTVEYTTDANDWTVLGDFDLSQGPGVNTYPGQAIDLGGLAASSIRLTVNDNFGTQNSYGLGEVQFMYVPVRVREPSPADGATDVDPQIVLNWRPGREAVSHEIYLSTDANAVADGTASIGSTTASSYDLGKLDLAMTYYWKIDEVNEAATPSVWEGDVWSLTTRDYIPVEDFESYNDEDNQIFNIWIDGYENNANGSLIGHANPPYAEQGLVHSGDQSAPLSYDNTGTASISEATLTLPGAQDWTAAGAQTLVLYFRGRFENGAGQLYIKINGTRVDYDGSVDALKMPLWKQWDIDLASLSATARSVTTLTVGVSGSGAGLVYLDDIQLYREAPPIPGAADPGTANLVAHYQMENNLTDSSGNGYDGTPVMSPSYGPGPAGYGTALVLDGVGSYAELAIGSLIPTMDSATVVTWLNLADVTSTWQRAWDFGNGSANEYMFLCPRSDPGTLWFAITTAGGGGESVIQASTMPSGGDWHHLATVIDAETMTVQLYVDGDMVASGPTETLPSDLGETTQNWLGRSQYDGDSYLDGSLDDFRIYDRALTIEEVRYLVGDR